jgi:Rrf2 family protein
VQHVLQISRKIDYALRAMIHLASQPPERIATLQDVTTTLHLPREFLAKILKLLTARGLVRSVRGAHGGYQLARPAREISFLEVIEATEGPVQLNVCLDDKDRCDASAGCTMYHVWKAGQERMLEVYRRTTLAELAEPALAQPISIGLPRASSGMP